jgi:hypothetical protein
MEPHSARAPQKYLVEHLMERLHDGTFREPNKPSKNTGWKLPVKRAVLVARLSSQSLCATMGAHECATIAVGVFISALDE